MNQPFQASKALRVYVLLLGLAAVGLLVFALIVVRQQTQDKFETCSRAGGHLVDVGRDIICVSSDGRIIET